MADAEEGTAGDHSVEPEVHRYWLGRNVIPERLMLRVRMAVAIGLIQEELIRRKRLSSSELGDYAWSVMEDAPDADGGRVLRVIATPVRSTDGRKPPRRL